MSDDAERSTPRLSRADLALTGFALGSMVVSLLIIIFGIALHPGD